MEEYEVDLRDYIRVLWRWKWLVAAVVVVAVGLSVGLTLATPDNYRGQALVSVDIPEEARQAYEGPSLDNLALRITDSRFLAGVVDDTDVSAGWLAGELDVRMDADMLRLILEAEISPTSVETLLLAVVEAVEEHLQDELAQGIGFRLEQAEAQRQLALARKEEWQAQFAAAKEQAEAQRDRLRAQIDRVREDPEVLDLELADRLTVEGHLYMKELDLLYSRLQRVEIALDDMERQGVAYLSGAERVLESFREEVHNLEAEMAALEELQAQPPRLTTLVRSPEGTVRTLRPSLKMNLAVAGVLGLFVGVLLAFFTEAMSRPREA